jgi:hypothetical protein
MTITGKIDIDEKTVSLYQWALLPATNSDCYKEITVEYYQKNVLVREVQFSKAFVVDYTEQYSNHTGVGTFSIYLRQFYKQDIDVTTEETKTVNSEAMVVDESEEIEAVQQAENSPVEKVVESTNKASMSFTDRVEKQKEMGDNSNAGVGKIPQGLTGEQFANSSKLIRQNVGNISDDIVVQGSRAGVTAKATSDIDYAIRVSPEKFDDLIKQRFGTPNPGSAKERTMLHAIETGKIQAGEAGLRGLRIQLQETLGIDVDISIIKSGGSFDNGPMINIPK